MFKSFRTLALKKRGRKLLKITGIVFGILVVLLTAFHFWFKAHAKEMIEDLVKTTSNGKVKLTIGKLHFNYFSRKIRLDNAVFVSTDTIEGNTSYRFSVQKIDLRAKAILPILFKKKFLIDSLALSNPDIEVVRLRAAEKTGPKAKDVSIPEEMGKIYSSIQDALAVLKVKRFVIDNGTFTLINRITPNQLPMTVSNLHFQIDNLQVDSSKLDGKDKILFSDNVTFTSHNQDILFPDGRHRLSFSHFRINLQKKLVEFDSCTIAATRSDSASAAFNVFFDGLDLTNIDFDTLYKSEVIKADSVYCINPRFNLEVDVSKRKEAGKPAPKLENIIQQLTGDLLLNHVVVTNADFNIKTIKDGRPSTFTFSKNNFEMQGLSIDQEAARPVKVKSFAMAIRNYENFIKDSSYSIQFDSVILKDDRVTLNNFIFHKLENGKILNTFSIPQFNLQGLSWDDLVFERRLKAEQAIMFNPHISYTASPKPGRQNIFVSLGAVNEYMDLQFLDIRDGMIDLRLKNDLQIHLENANVAVQSNSLLTSTKLSSIKNSLTNLSFKRGSVQAGDLLIELDGLRYAGPNDRFEAATMHVKSEKQEMDISLREVTAEKMLLDETNGNVLANGLNWQKGNIKMRIPGSRSPGNKNGSVIELSQVNGRNTSLQIFDDKTSITTILNTIRFSELIRNPGMPLQLTGAIANGQDLQVENDHLRFSVNAYDIQDKQRSVFRELKYNNHTRHTTTDITAPILHITPDIQSLIGGNVRFGEVSMDKPIIHIDIAKKKNEPAVLANRFPSIDIRGFKLTQPYIRFRQTKDSGMLSLDWNGTKDPSNFLQANELFVAPGNYQFSNLQFFLTHFNLTKPGKKIFSTGNGQFNGHLRSGNVQMNGDGEAEWQTDIATLNAIDFRLDSIGRSKANFILATGSIENLSLTSSTIINLRELAAANHRFHLKKFTGQLSDQHKQMHWYNAGFIRDRNIFTADSFSVTPALARDSFLARQSFQKDYITVSSGAVRLGPVDLDSYISNNKLKIGSMLIDGLHFTDYKDKSLPFNPGIIKPLPAQLLKKVPWPFAVDTVWLTNAKVLYTETSEKSQKEGSIPVTRMNARLMNVSNVDNDSHDSLSIEASGWLLDKAPIRLTVKESYTDSLGGFLMTAQAGAADLRFLNPVIIPLAMTKIESGWLDTIYMKATGREYLAWGEMQMRYRDLKVSLLKDGEDEKRKLASRIANTIIKNKNESRTGDVFFIRQRDRSAINYLIKIAMSGISSSIGAKNNKKLIRQHKDEIEKKK